jgi:hypothetical protein
MKVTNEQNLPIEFVKAVNVNRHNAPGTYSATTLNKGAREIILTERHFDDIVLDVSDNVWALFGTAVHSILENQDGSNFKEEYFENAVSNSKVTGRVDSYDMENGIVYDWKTASAWKVIYKDFSDWDNQAAVYAWLLRKNNLECNKVVFVAFLKDHSKTKAKTDSTYPQSAVYKHEVLITDELMEFTEKRLTAKVKQLESMADVADDELPVCNTEERWASPDVWAIMKKGRKSALKLCYSQDEADRLLEEKGGDYIEYRKGEDKKCADYCPCRDFCSYWKHNH